MRWSLLFLILFAQNKAFAQCPPAYHVVASPVPDNCLPDLPTTDFIFDAGNGYPVCGFGRIALAADGSYSSTTFSSSQRPRSSVAPYSYTQPGFSANNYSYTWSSLPNPPVYGFQPNSRCYCMDKGTTASFGETPGAAAGNYLPQSVTGGARQYPVTYDVISTQDPLASVSYGPVAINKDGTIDGRNGGLFGGGTSSCGCPNFNEETQANGTDGANWVGTHCVPTVIDAPTGTRVLANYSSGMSAMIMPSTEPIADGSGNPITTIMLPNSGADQVGTSSYSRKIWTCAAPYELDTASGRCTFQAPHHKCDDGSGGTGSFVSPVSDVVTPVVTLPALQKDNTAQFNNTVNRKLACCLNAFHLDGSDPYEKFDCIDNSTDTYTTFDDLWSSSDNATDGGQLNAVLLSAGTKVVSGVTLPIMVTGFYSLSGTHCDQFSEFAYSTDIKHYRLNPILKVQSQNQVGASPVNFGTDIPIPTSSAYSAINTLVTGTWGKTAPSTAQDYASCPVLVRAAIVASCPQATAVPNALTSVPLSATGKPRCPVAGGIQVQIKMEQIFEITGQPVMKPLDTIVTVNQTTSIDVAKLIADKVGDQCPPFTTKKGDNCGY